MERKRPEKVLQHRVTDLESRLKRTQFETYVIDKYMSFVQPPELQRTFQDIIEKLDSIRNLLVSVQASVQVTSDYQNARAISERRLEQIQFKDSNFAIGTVIAKIQEMFKMAEPFSVDPSVSNLVVTADWTMLCTLLTAVRSVISSSIQNIVLSVTTEPPLLRIAFHDKALMKLQDTLRSVDELVELRTSVTETHSSDTAASLFIAKSIAQSNEGDLELIDDELIVTFLVMKAQEQAIIASIPLPAIIPIPAPVPESHPQPNVVSNPLPPPSDALPETPPPSTTKSLVGKTLQILFAEDAEILQKIFTRHWTTKGHVVHIANNGQEALEKYKVHPLNIIFMDIEMPIKNGLLVTREIRDMERERGLPRVPIIGMSGHSLKQYAETALQSGMDGFLSKGSGYPYKEVEKIVLEYCGT